MAESDYVPSVVALRRVRGAGFSCPISGRPPSERYSSIPAPDRDAESRHEARTRRRRGPLADRIGVLDSAWRLLPDVAREDSAATLLEAGSGFQALAGPSVEQLEDWKQWFPPPTVRAAQGRAKPRTVRREDNGPSEEASWGLLGQFAERCPILRARASSYRGALMIEPFMKTMAATSGGGAR